MYNRRETKYPMPVQDPLVRNHNFKEVALGYDAETAVCEAERCLSCKNRPCVKGCPVSVAIPEFIAKIAEGDFEAAYRIISESSSLPAVCGRVCPQERQCEGNCIRGIKGEPVAIGRLERFAADMHYAGAGAIERPISNGHRVAVVGSGPAGLACAGDLAKMGYDVTVFEALHAAGGVLSYGIPEFRLPKEIVKREVENLIAMGVKLCTDSVIGRLYSVEELRTELGFEAVFLGTGAGLPRFLGIRGENLKGVFSANEYLTRANLMRAYEEDSETPIYHAKRVAVLGGGNVAMDAARTAKRLGAEVTIVYRRGMEELPARKEEILHAREEGVELRLLTNPVELLGDAEGNVCAVECVEMELGAPDESGRRRPVKKVGSEFRLEADCVILALGTSPNPLLQRTTAGLETKPHGEISADGDGKTSLEGVFAGGDAVTGSATVILAMGAGRRAARAIDAYISSAHR